METYSITELNETTYIDFDSDYVEMVHSTYPENGSYMTYKYKVSNIVSSIADDITNTLKLQNTLSVVEYRTGDMFYHTVCGSYLSSLSSQLLSGDWVPMSRIEGKRVVFLQDISSHILNGTQYVAVYRSDVSSTLDFFGQKTHSLVKSYSNGFEFNVDFMKTRFPLFSQTNIGEKVESSAPSISGSFPTGNKILDVTDETELLSGCMGRKDASTHVYTSEQDFTLKSGLLFDIDISRCSQIYGNVSAQNGITPRTVEYVPCMFIRDHFDTIPLYVQ